MNLIIMLGGVLIAAAVLASSWPIVRQMNVYDTIHADEPECCRCTEDHTCAACPYYDEDIAEMAR